MSRQSPLTMRIRALRPSATQGGVWMRSSPTPERTMRRSRTTTWKEFVQSHLDVLVDAHLFPFALDFQEALATGGVKCTPTPARSPNWNVHTERWVRSIKEECLSKLISFGSTLYGASCPRQYVAIPATISGRVYSGRDRSVPGANGRAVSV
jgi:hypothetical protein